MTAFFCSSDISRSFDMPALPAQAMPAMQTAMPNRITWPECGAQHLRDELAVEDRRHQRAEGGAVAQHHGHAQRHAQIAHGQSEGESAESPQHAEEIDPEQRAAGRFVQRRPAGRWS